MVVAGVGVGREEGGRHEHDNISLELHGLLHRGGVVGVGEEEDEKRGRALSKVGKEGVGRKMRGGGHSEASIVVLPLVLEAFNAKKKIVLLLGPTIIFH